MLVIDYIKQYESLADTFILEIGDDVIEIQAEDVDEFPSEYLEMEVLKESRLPSSNNHYLICTM